MSKSHKTKQSYVFCFNTKFKITNNKNDRLDKSTIFRFLSIDVLHIFQHKVLHTQNNEIDAKEQNIWITV